MGLGPVTVRAGDGLCRLEHRADLRRPGPLGTDGLALAAAGLSIDPSGWALGMATQARLRDGRVRHGFDFFDDHGQPVLKLDLGAEVAPDDFYDIVLRFVLGTEAGDTCSSGASVDWAAPKGQPRACGLLYGLKARGAVEVLQELADQDLAQALPCDALLSVLQHARQSRLPLSARFACSGLRLDWSGHLHHLEERSGVAIASDLDIKLQWSESPSALPAWLLREPTARGLMQSLALLAPDGEVRLLLAPLHAPERPEPCAWRSAISAVCGSHLGSAC